MKKGFGSYVELERRRRILLSVWAYAYEVENDNLVPDEVFDAECLKVDLLTDTGDELLDMFFLQEFSPDTGNWIHKHPELDKIKGIYEKYHRI